MKKKRLYKFSLIGSSLVFYAGLLLLVYCEGDFTKADRRSVDQIPLCGNPLGASTELLDTLGAPVWRDDIGGAYLSITTEQPAAQAWFDQGLNYLHGFWYLEAYRAFKQVMAIDPDCAMGYWGLDMCQPGCGGDNFSKWRAAITQVA